MRWRRQMRKGKERGIKKVSIRCYSNLNRFLIPKNINSVSQTLEINILGLHLTVWNVIATSSKIKRIKKKTSEGLWIFERSNHLLSWSPLLFCIHYFMYNKICFPLPSCFINNEFVDALPPHIPSTNLHTSYLCQHKHQLNMELTLPTLPLY